MPELTWVGKEKIITHHLDVPFRVLNRQYSFDRNGPHVEDNGSENMIIQGDNLEALKALLPSHEGKIDCIYIDPPYNTGNEGWVYNDNVNDPQIRKWLGEVVGKEGDDLSRHDKWLCMMYPRLRLLSRLLSPNGSMAISLSHHELDSLLAILREIFAAKQIVTTIVQTSGGKPSNGFNFTHEFLVFVTPKVFEPRIRTLSTGTTRSPFEGLTLSTFDKVQRPNQVYPIFVDKQTYRLVGVGKSLQQLIESGAYQGEKEDYVYETDETPEGAVAVWPITTKGKDCVWRQVPSRLLNDWEKGYIKIGAVRNRISIQYLPQGVIKKISEGKLNVLGTEKNAPTLRFGKNTTAGSQIPTLFLEKEFYTVSGTREIGAIFPENPKAFNYPKPTALVAMVIEYLCPPGGVVLDSFAGSGTTGHAVQLLNDRDDAKRSYVMIELGDYADGVTAERIKRASVGFDFDNESVPGIGGDFSFYTLGEALFKEGLLNPAIPTSQIRDYIWHTETGSTSPSASGSSFAHFLGKYSDTSYIFAYEKDRSTVLDLQYLATIPAECAAESYVIFADKCLLAPEELRELNITFKKIPRDIAHL